MGGAETLVVNLIPRLQALGNTVDLCIFNEKETPLTQRLRKESPQTKIYALGHGVYNPLYILKLIKIMRNYDIVHTHNSSPQLFVAIANLFCSQKLVSTEHTTSNRKRDWKWYAPIESWMYGQYYYVICISQIAEDKLREYMGGVWLDKTNPHYNQISTINNGVDVKAISNATPDNDLLALKAKRKIPRFCSRFTLHSFICSLYSNLKSILQNVLRSFLTALKEDWEKSCLLCASL